MPSRLVYVKAEIHPEDLALGELRDGGETRNDPMQLWFSARAVATAALFSIPCVWLHRRDVARLLFAGQRERLAAYERSRYIADTIRLADAAERRIA